MIRRSHPRSLARLLAMVLLAYGLALNGLLGAIGAGAHVSEARTAAQLGVICTIHGIGNNPGGADDPTPGKLACIEQCVIAAASAMPGMPGNSVALARPDRLAEAANRSAVAPGHRIASVAAPPPSRGPPGFI